MFINLTFARIYDSPKKTCTFFSLRFPFFSVRFVLKISKGLIYGQRVCVCVCKCVCVCVCREKRYFVVRYWHRQIYKYHPLTDYVCTLQQQIDLEKRVADKNTHVHRPKSVRTFS